MKIITTILACLLLTVTAFATPTLTNCGKSTLDPTCTNSGCTITFDSTTITSCTLTFDSGQEASTFTYCLQSNPRMVTLAPSQGTATTNGGIVFTPTSPNTSLFGQVTKFVCQAEPIAPQPTFTTQGR